MHIKAHSRIQIRHSRSGCASSKAQGREKFCHLEKNSGNVEDTTLLQALDNPSCVHFPLRWGGCCLPLPQVCCYLCRRHWKQAGARVRTMPSLPLLLCKSELYGSMGNFRPWACRDKDSDGSLSPLSTQPPPTQPSNPKFPHSLIPTSAHLLAKCGFHKIRPSPS